MTAADAVRLAAWGLVVLYVGVGMVRFDPWRAMRDERFVTRPDEPFWSWLRFLRDSEWTERGLAWRRGYVAWSSIGFVLVLAALAMTFS